MNLGEIRKYALDKTYNARKQKRKKYQTEIELLNSKKEKLLI